MKNLTSRQKEVLTLVRTHIDRHGYPPTLRELARSLGLEGTRGVVKHLETLERKGAIRRRPGVSRGIEIVGKLWPGTLSGAVPVPILGSVPAGRPDLAVEDDIGTLVLDGSMADDAAFLLRVTGDSMSGDHIRAGDMVLVRKQETAEDGQLVVAMIDGEATVKRLHRREGRIILQASHPDYPPVELAAGDGDVSLIGRVKAVIRLLDR